MIYSLEAELSFCAAVLDRRFEQYFSAKDNPKKLLKIEDLEPPDLSHDDSPYGNLVNRYGLNFDERLLMALALAPYLCPQMLDMFFLNNGNLGRPYTEFGGWKGKSHSGFLPTCETALFVLAGDNLDRRLSVMSQFDPDCVLLKNHLIVLEYGEPGEPSNSAALRPSPEVIDYILTGKVNKPDYSSHFPAKRITSNLSWEDLVLNSEAMEDINQIFSWVLSFDDVLDSWGLRKNVKPGYRVLFYGPPGTGKTLTATLIGARTGMDVYRVDLSQVVSKYIGETEKNLSVVFDQAERCRWILFFDEADSLFGARTHAGNANDMAANREIAYLLQRVEDYPGVVILASNLKSNIDAAFARRFQASIYFPMPESSERLRLWNNLFPDKSRLAPDVNLSDFADKYELAGGALSNVARYAVLKAVGEGRHQVTNNDLELGISKELRKEGKTI